MRGPDRRRAGLGPAVLAGALAAFGPASAHHSGAMFDRTRIVTVQGEVVEYSFTNPHPQIRLMSLDPADGKKEFDLEAPSLMHMRAAHIVPSTLKPGDRITVRMHPIKDGRPAGSLIELTMPDGKVSTFYAFQTK